MAMSEVEAYIRRAAALRNIDPDVAVRVAMTEGGLANPYRRGEGPAPKSQLSSHGSTENSWGPYQLYISGTGAGLGDRALAAGVDPRKDWRAGVDFGLDEVTRKGWDQWYGAKGAGITGMMGVGEGAKPQGVTLSSTPIGNVVPGAGQFTQNVNTQLADTGAPPPAPGSAAEAAPTSFLDKLKGVLGGDDAKSLTKAVGPREGDTGELAPSSLGASMAGADAARMQAGQQLMATLLAGRKRKGVTLNTPPLSMMG